jgi:hemoglobin-like flavoprotein
MMSPKNIEMVTVSFGRLALAKAKVAEDFYNRLFEIDPSLRKLFKSDIKAQGEKLMMTISIAVSNLKNPNAIRNTVVNLGKRHVTYGVTSKDYQTVAQALLFAVEKNLGDAFTPEIKAAWVEMYTVVAGMMQEAA